MKVLAFGLLFLSFLVAGRRGANGQNASRVSSSLILDSDEEFSASRSPSDVLAYKEVIDTLCSDLKSGFSMVFLGFY